MAYFKCNKCNQKYASTDGVRKHARNKHKDWVNSLKPTDYCTRYQPYNFSFKELITLLTPLPPIYSMTDDEILTLLTLGHHYIKELTQHKLIEDNELVEEWFSQL
jgi:hypothetical protein